MSTSQVTPSLNQNDPNNPPAPAGQPQPMQASQPTQPGPQNGQPTNGQPTNSQGNQPAAQPPANQPPQPHDIFKSILKTLNGGPMYVTAPDGSRQEVPQTKGQLGKSILAGALAGLFTPNQYRTGYKGAQVIDRGNTIAAAGQAGMQMKEAQQQRAQQISDEQQTKKLMTLQNNAKQVQLSAAMAHEKMSALDDTLAYNQKNLIDPLDDFEKNLPPGEPSIYVAKGLTADQVLAKDPQTGQPAHKLTDGNVFISGKVTKPDAQGVLESEPTYSIVRNDFSVKLPEATTQELAKFDKRFDNAYKATNGNVMLPINTYLDRIHVANELTATEDFLDRVNRQINGDNAKPIDLAAAYRKNPSALQPAIDAMTQARAAGQARGEGTDDQVIRAIWNANNGTKLLSLIGDPTAVAKWGQNQENERKRAEVEAAQKNPDKEQASPEAIADLRTQVGLLPEGQRPVIWDGMSNGQVAAASKQASTAARLLEQQSGGGIQVPKGFVPNPNAFSMDSVDLQNELKTKKVNLPSNFEALYAVAHNAADLKTLPTRPTKTGQMDAQTGLSFIRQYINPQYQEGDYAAAANLSKELASTKSGTAGYSLLSAGTAANHLELLNEAATALKNNDVQAMNHLANTLGVQFGKSPAVTFKAIADQVNGEVGKVVAGGSAVHEAELDALRKNLNSDQSPEQVQNVIKSYIGLMDGRISEINDRSQQYFGRDVKGVSPAAARVFAKYGFDAPGYVRVQIPGQPVGSIPAAQAKAFKAKYPNAQIGGQ